MDYPSLSELGLSLTDIMDRRFKNRERQRRYRQRKRLRLNPCKVFVPNQSSEMQFLALPTNVPVVQPVTRIYCKRDWKKDARRVYALNRETVSNGIASVGLSLSGTLGTGTTVQSEVQVPSEDVRRKLCKRNWKAEARAKKN